MTAAIARPLARTACLLLVALAAASAGATEYIVNSSDDDSDQSPGDGTCWTGGWVVVGQFGVYECTLRAALEESNASAGADDIAFSSRLTLNSAGYVVLNPTTPLPWIHDTVTIDGTTHPGYDDGDPWAFPVIVLNGISLSNEHGLVIGDGNGSADGTVVRGLSIIHSDLAGIFVVDADATIEGCGIGLYRGQYAGPNGTGIHSYGNRLTVGRTCHPTLGCSGLGNVISANLDAGVETWGADVVVAGNRIGTDNAGTSALGNGGAGVYAVAGRPQVGGTGGIGSPNPTPVTSGNLISGNGSHGVFAWLNAVDVFGNRIGTDVTGTTALPNGGSGVYTEVGNSIVSRENVISGNALHGVHVNALVASGETWISENAIGVAAAMDAPLGNGLSGIRIEANDGPGARIQGNVVGSHPNAGVELLSGDNVLERNYVGTNASGQDLGNGIGIEIASDHNWIGDFIGETGLVEENTVAHNASDGIRIHDGDHNWILNVDLGTDGGGADLGNGGYGVRITGTSHDNRIGPDWTDLTEEGQMIPGSRIGRNALGGVGVETTSIRNAIRNNRFEANGGEPIDLGLDGATPNDDFDRDLGANHLQNAPEIDPSLSFWHQADDQIVVHYRVDTDPATATYPIHVDFHVDSTVFDDSGYLGTDEIPLAEAMQWRTVTLPAHTMTVPGGDWLHAIAIDAEGAGNSSEQGAPIQVPEPGLATGLASGAVLLLALARRRAA